MAHDKLQHFRQKVHDDAVLLRRLRKAALEHEGRGLDDRALFDAVIVPVALASGVSLTYDEAKAELQLRRERIDRGLEAVADEAEPVYRKAMAGVLAASIAFSGVPAAALAKGAGKADDGEEDSQAALVEDGAPDARGDDGATQADDAAAQGDAASDPAADDAAAQADAASDQAADDATAQESAASDQAVDPTAAQADDATMQADAADDPVADAAAAPAGDPFEELGGETSEPASLEAQAEGSAADAEAELQAAMEGTQAYAADFAMDDVALPQGLAATADGIVVTGEVAPAVAAAVEQSGSVAQDAGSGVSYEVGKLDYVDTTTHQVKALGSGVFDAVAAGTSGYAKAGVVGVKKLLELAGVLGSKDTVTPELLSQMKQINALLQDMSKRLDENTKQTYQNRLTVFDNAVGALDIECGTMEAMYQKGYALAEQRGLLKTADKNGGLSNVLVKLMRDEDAKGNADFRDFATLMASIRTNYETVAVECAKEGGASPFYAYDSYWALYFNFDTQGYYLRQAYRTNAVLQLKRSYTLLALYYDLPKTLDAGKAAEPLTASLQAALKGIEAQPAGASPEEVLDFINESETARHLKIPVHCYVTGRDYLRSMAWKFMGELEPEYQISEEQAKAFCDRLHGRTVAEDLRLAGLMVDYTPQWNKYLEEHGKDLRIPESNYPGLGIGYDDSHGKDNWKNIYLPFDATSYTPQTCPSYGYEVLVLSMD